MIQAASSLWLALALVLGAASPLTAAPPSVRHSGRVVAIDAQSGTLILDEVGPWRRESGRTVVTRLTIALTAETHVTAVFRVNAPGAFVGDFIEVALGAADLVPGDYVTADCVHERRGLRAVSVTVAELD